MKGESATFGGPRTWLAVFVLLLSFGGGVTWYFYDAYWAGRARAAALAWADLSRCAIGDPLAEGETLRQRLRSIELALLAAPDETWPKRCQVPAHELWLALPDGHPLKLALNEHLGCSDSCAFGELGPQLAALMDVGYPDKVSSQHEPPRRLGYDLLTSANMPSLGKEISDRRRLTDGRLGLTIDGEHCVLADKLECQKEPRRDYAIGKKDNTLYVVLREPGKKPSGTALPDDADHAFIAGDHAFWFEGDTLFVAAVDDVASSVKLGDVPRAPPHACRYAVMLGQHMVVRRGSLWKIAGVPLPLQSPPAPAKPNPARNVEEATDFGIIGLLGDGDDDAGSAWKLPDDMQQKTEALFGKPAKDKRRARTRRSDHALVCEDGRATVTWRELGPMRIKRTTCSFDGCTQSETPIADIATRSWWLASTLAGKLVMLWRGQDGAVRMRFDKREIVIMDSVHHGGPETDQLETFAGSSAISVVFHDGKHLRGFRVDASGIVFTLD